MPLVPERIHHFESSISQFVSSSLTENYSLTSWYISKEKTKHKLNLPSSNSPNSFATHLHLSPIPSPLPLLYSFHREREHMGIKYFHGADNLRKEKSPASYWAPFPPATNLLLERKVTSINTQHVWHSALMEIKAEIINAWKDFFSLTTANRLLQEIMKWKKIL